MLTKHSGGYLLFENLLTKDKLGKHSEEDTLTIRDNG